MIDEGGSQEKKAPIMTAAEMEAAFADEAAARALFDRFMFGKEPADWFCKICSATPALEKDVKFYRIKDAPRRIGRWKCSYCGGQFTATSGTDLNGLKLPAAIVLQLS